MQVKPAVWPDDSPAWVVDGVRVNSDILWRIIEIDRDRYSGCYSGAGYTAWPGVRPDDIDAGDTACSSFWSEHNDALHGKGSSPQEAFRDLQTKIEAGGYWDNDSLQVVFVIDDCGPDAAVLLAGSTEFQAWLEQGQ